MRLSARMSRSSWQTSLVEWVDPEPVVREWLLLAACGLVAVGSIVTLPTQSTRRVS